MYIHLTTEYTFVKFSFSSVSKFPVINLEVTQEKNKMPRNGDVTKNLLLSFVTNLNLLNKMFSHP